MRSLSCDRLSPCPFYGIHLLQRQLFAAAADASVPLIHNQHRWMTCIIVQTERNKDAAIARQVFDSTHAPHTSPYPMSWLQTWCESECLYVAMSMTCARVLMSHLYECGLRMLIVMLQPTSNMPAASPCRQNLHHDAPYASHTMDTPCLTGLRRTVAVSLPSAVRIVLHIPSALLVHLLGRPLPGPSPTFQPPSSHHPFTACTGLPSS